MSPLLEEAMKAIHSRTNISTGLAHPNDKNAAKEMFKRLHEHGEVLLKNEVSGWAQANGWDSKDADELGALAEQIGMGKKVRIVDGWWNDDIIEIMQSRIDEND